MAFRQGLYCRIQSKLHPGRDETPPPVNTETNSYSVRFRRVVHKALAGSFDYSWPTLLSHTRRIVQCGMSLNATGDSNAERARTVDLIPMRDEPEQGKLLMNAIQHEEPGPAQFERDERTAFEQPEGDMESGEHRGRVRVDRRRAEGAGIPQARQAGERHRASIPAKGHGHQPRPIDKADRPMDGRPENRTPDGGDQR